MSYRIPLPDGGRRTHLDIIEPNSTAVQRFIRREGLAAYEPPTAAAVLALCEQLGSGFTMFDVGANMGLYGSLVASVFKPEMVHLFEPAPTAARVAERIVAKNSLRAEVFEVAVSETSGVGKLQLSPVSDASNSMVEGFREATGVLDVTTIRLDDHVRRTGRHPDLLKIDVETFEPAVLRGARSVLERDRPVIVIEVLKRRGTDHGVVIGELMADLGYHNYELTADPTWEARDRITGSGTTNRDWLLSPEPLDRHFGERWKLWFDRMQACDVERNPRAPVWASMRAAYGRGGLAEIVATGRRYLAARRREANPESRPADQLP